MCTYIDSSSIEKINSSCKDEEIYYAAKNICTKK